MRNHTLFLIELLIFFLMVNPVESICLIDPEGSHISMHGRLSCLESNLWAAEFGHNNQDVRDCRSCHLPHDEKVAHDAHVNVSCEVCHLKGVRPVKDRENNRITWGEDLNSSGLSEIHEILITGDDAMCARCHFKDNDLGVSAKVLPAKSVICMPCHSGTFSVLDVPTIIALLVFITGLINLLLIWFSGRPRNEKKNSGKGIPFKGIFKMIGIILLDIVLQRRLFIISRFRWFIHGLIFYAILLRFIWGLVSLLSSLWFKEWPGVMVMLDKNHPITALLFDATGVTVVIGVILMIIRSKLDGSVNRPDKLPARDWTAYGLLGGIFVAGFVLEGMRISMTGASGTAGYAFLGYGISRLFSNLVLNNIYAYFWYVHAILTAVFVAYLPFSRMLHVIIAPISLVVKACSVTRRS